MTSQSCSRREERNKRWKLCDRIRTRRSDGTLKNLFKCIIYPLILMLFHYNFTDFLLLLFRYMLYPILCCFSYVNFFLEKEADRHVAPTINREPTFWPHLYLPSLSQP